MGRARGADDQAVSREGELDAALAAARTGDPAGFATVYREHQPSLLRYLRVLVGPEAEDVASETWLQATRDLHRFPGSADGLRPWLLTIARHRALDALRAQRRRPVDSYDPATLPEHIAQGDTEALTEESLATRRALALIATLPQDQAEAVLLRVVLGLDAPAAAAVLGKRAGAVRMATSRGLAKLAGLVDQKGVTPETAAALKEVR
jgi:RNA polymerase sigma-70 factor (ECF subfamily)